MDLERTITLANWLEPPYNRKAFQRVRELVPTALIRNHSGTTRPLNERPAAHIDTLPVALADGSMVGLGEQLERSCCDTLCVVHDGAIVFERYLNGMRVDTPHLLMSVSKSLTAATLGISIGRGLLAADDLVCDIAPEFTDTSLDGATVQHVIDMATGTDFVEDYDLYDDPHGGSPLVEYERQAGYRPMGGHEPIGTLAHFRTYGTAYEHGSRFDYRSPLTNIAARVVELVNGMRFPDIVSRDLWGPLGQQHDADIMLDALGHPVVEGGISCTVRDLARFGQAYLDHGVVDGRQVIPTAWIDDTAHATDRHVEMFAAAGYAEMGSHYRNGFWVMERDMSFSGLGIFGQYCFVHRPSRTVIARFSTYPSALPMEQSNETLATFTTLCEALS